LQKNLFAMSLNIALQYEMLQRCSNVAGSFCIIWKVEEMALI